MSPNHLFSKIGALTIGLVGGVFLGSASLLLARDTEPQARDEVVAAAGTNTDAYVLTRRGLVFRISGRGANPIQQVGNVFSTGGDTQTPSRQTRAPAQAATPAMGLLRVVVTPAAAVTLDGQELGTQTRLMESLLPGAHRIRLRADGYVTKDTTITVAAGDTVTIRLRMARIP